MSLDLTLYDDAALEALAPKGVVRRARRDLESGLAAIRERDGKAAVVEAEGQTVRIDARGPKAAQCTCPASGICRHILVAVMALNADAGAAPVVEREVAGPSAADEICALAQADVQAFAGADWAAAVALAAASAGSTVEETGRNCTVEIAGSPASVTFLAGLALKGAAFKGSKTRARLLVAAAALILRTRRGVATQLSAEEDKAAGASVAREYLDDATQKLVQCARMVLAGASPVAADTLFDLAISARAEAAPRLTAQLRALTKQAGQAAERMIQFEPETFLADTARAYALIEALKREPGDPVLTGVVRRDYRPAPAFDLWMLGAARWSTETGARGLTVHGFAPAERQWRYVAQARGPGMDPTFDPTLAYTMPLWSVVSAKKLVGSSLHIGEPLLSPDGAISPTLPAAPLVQGAVPNARTLIEAGAAMVAWADLRREVTARLGSGLRRRSTPIAVLIAPTKFGSLGFDDFTQNYELEALDPSGDAVRLTLPTAQHLFARRLSEMSRPPLLLAETAGDLDRPALRPISVVYDGAQRLEIVNLTLDEWTRDQSNPLGALANLLPRKSQGARLSRDPLAELARRALAEAATICAGEPAPDLRRLEQECDAAGLATLAGALRRIDSDRSARVALATAYIAGEALAELSWA